MHNSSADELLRTRPVSELRQMIGSLEKDCAAKQTELRQMVGSKYLDFIESDDAISSMYRETERLSSAIAKFATASTTLVGKVHDVIDRTSRPSSVRMIENSNNKSDSLTHSTSSTVRRSIFTSKVASLDSSKVWDYLEACDVSNASKSILITKYFIHICETLHKAKLQDSSNLLMSKPAYCDTILPNSSNLVSMISSIEYNEKRMISLWQLLKLSNTVLGDCELILLSPNSSIYDVANSLIAMSALGKDSKTDRPLSKLELMKLYLSKMDILLDANIKQASAAGSKYDELTASEADFRDGDKSSNGSKSDAIASNLINLVKSLKRILLFVHNIFFRSVQSSANDLHQLDLLGEEGLSDSQNKSTLLSHDGILEALELSYFDDVSSDLIRYIQSNFNFNSDCKFEPFRFQVHEFSKKRTISNSIQEKHSLQSTFESWFGELAKKISKLLYHSLGLMDSATKIAVLQQQLWKEITQQSPISTGKDNEFLQQNDWELACKTLLSSSKYGADLSSNSASGNGKLTPKHSSLLWSAIFRKPFMTQVERILNETCIEIFDRIKSKIQQTLVTEGISVDVNNKKVTLLSSHSAVSSSFSSSTVLRRVTPGIGPSTKSNNSGNSTSNTGESHIDNCFESFHSMVSMCQTLRIYRHAENIRSIIENEFKVLLDGAVLPAAQEGDALTSSALARALFVQSCHLIGHISIYMRELSELLSVELIKALGLKHPNPKRSFLLPKIKSESSTFLRIPNSQELKLFCGILFMGRLSWVLKLRNEVLLEVLSTSRIRNSIRNASLSPEEESAAVVDTEGSWSSRDFEFCSEDQLMSAFEIADTDGDGVLTHAETLEAIQALVVSDDSSGNTEVSHDTISKFTTPSVSFAEFALIYSHLLTFKDCSVINKHFRQCLDDIMHLNHHIWSEASILLCNSQLHHSLYKEFGIKLGSTSLSVHAFQTPLWKDHLIGNHNNSDIKIRAPYSISQSCCHYWFSLSTIMSIFSTIDSCHVNPISTTGAQPTSKYSKATLDLKYGVGANPVKSLYLHMKKLIYTKSISSVIEIYRDVLSFLESGRSTLTSVDEANSESIAIQCIFDLITLESICASENDSDTNSIVEGLISKFRGFVDPVNESSILPIIRDSCKQFMSRSTLLNLFVKPLDKAVPLVGDSAGDAATPPKAPSYDLFSTSAPARFGLLALPISLSNPSASGSQTSSKLKQTNTATSSSSSSTSSTTASSKDHTPAVMGTPVSTAGSGLKGIMKGVTSLFGSSSGAAN